VFLIIINLQFEYNPTADCCLFESEHIKITTFFNRIPEWSQSLPWAKSQEDRMARRISRCYSLSFPCVR